MKTESLPCLFQDQVQPLHAAMKNEAIPRCPSVSRACVCHVKRHDAKHDDPAHAPSKKKIRTSSCFNIILCSLLGQVMMAECIYPDECTMVKYRCVIVNKWFQPNRRSRDVGPRPGVRGPSRCPFRTAMSQRFSQAAGTNFPHVGLFRTEGVAA